MNETNLIQPQPTLNQRLHKWVNQPQIKHRMRIILVAEGGLLVCIWIFAWLVKYHHIFGLVWKS